MPNTREKLIELLCNTPAPEVVVFGQRCGKALATAEFIADHLIANGVTVHGDKDINVPSKWISVKDRLPEDDSNVLAYLPIGEEGRIYPANYAKGVWWDCIFNTPAQVTTHWMPLPQPPKGE